MWYLGRYRYAFPAFKRKTDTNQVIENASGINEKDITLNTNYFLKICFKC